MLESISFDLSRREIAVQLGTKEYVLREADGATAVLYRNTLMNMTEMEDGKVRKLRNVADIEPILVSRCLFEINESDRSLVPVTMEFVQALPSRILASLYSKAKDISELEEKTKTAGDKAKNGQSPGTDGSV